ncbi:unnamed protein product, partial [Heterosigma akashiwo]
GGAALAAKKSKAREEKKNGGGGVHHYHQKGPEKQRTCHQGLGLFEYILREIHRAPRACRLCPRQSCWALIQISGRQIKGNRCVQPIQRVHN